MIWQSIRPFLTWKTIKPVVVNVEVVGIFVALILAGRHSAEIKESANKLSGKIGEAQTAVGSVQKTVGDLQQSMSTRPLKSFPGFVDQIVKTIGGANDTVIVACDFPTYGDYDGVGLPIQQAIETKIATLKQGHVTLTFLNEPRRAKGLRAQFPQNEWEKAMRDLKHPLKRQKIVDFINRGHGQSKALTYPNFLDTFKKNDEFALQEFRHACFRQIPDDMPLLFWIADDDEAVMVVQEFGGHEDSAFVTSDRRLITALKSISKRYRQSVPAEPCESPD